VVDAEDILPNGTYQHVDGLEEGPLRRLTCILEVQTIEININAVTEVRNGIVLFMPAGDEREYPAVIWV
jgi:hypothetical protein